MAILRAHPNHIGKGMKLLGCSAPNLMGLLPVANESTRLVWDFFPTWWPHGQLTLCRPDGRILNFETRDLDVKAMQRLKESTHLMTVETSLFVFVFAGGEGGSHSFIHPVQFWKILDSKMWTCSNIFGTHRYIFLQWPVALPKNKHVCASIYGWSMTNLTWRTLKKALLSHYSWGGRLTSRDLSLLLPLGCFGFGWTFWGLILRLGGLGQHASTMELFTPKLGAR